jgi:hypothetical protein
MGFDSGSISFQRFAVVGQKPIEAGDLLEKIKAHAFAESDIGLPEAVEYGWVGPQHTHDGTFDYENCVFNDCLFFALRIDTNTPPASVKRAYQKLEEAVVAKGNPSGFISKVQKRIAKDAITRKLEDEMRAGKYRRSRHIPILWDLGANVLYGPTSAGAQEKLRELFERSFDLELTPLTSGTVALRHMSSLGYREAYENFTPTRFAKSPEDPDAPAEYPWSARGDGAKDFLGSEFLLWMWYMAAVRSGAIATTQGDSLVAFDRSLQLDCVFNHTGKESITAAGPTRLPEAIDGLRTGKVPRKAGLIFGDTDGCKFNLTLTADSLTVTTLRLPEIEDADTLRVLFEERITLLRNFDFLLSLCFNAFVEDRRMHWPARVSEIQKWIESHVKPIA